MNEKSEKTKNHATAEGVNSSELLGCPFCGKRPQDYQGGYTDGEGIKHFARMVQCRTTDCAASGKTFEYNKWQNRK